MTLGEVSVRLAVDSDIPEIVEIERVSFADPWSADSFEGSLDNYRMGFLVAEAAANGDRTLLGYVITLLLSDEAEVANLAVAPAGRRRGVGGLLLDRAIAEAVEKGVNTVYLEVRESNVAARALYDSRSFRHVGRRRGYYRHPVEDALLLRRDLATR